jgi:hypothetical protein
VEGAPAHGRKDDMMRKTRVAAATVMVAAGLMGAVAAPASAVTEYHFRLFEKASYHGFTNKGFRFKGGLFDPQDRHNRVGSDHGRCEFRPHDTEWCKGTFHLDGEIGGVGDIKYRGRSGVGRPFKVVGGSDDFAGATGSFEARFVNHNPKREINIYDFVVP